MYLNYGVGFNDRKYLSKVNGKTLKEYKLWNAMLYRCYSEKALSRDFGYIDCEVSENFKSYSYFYEWCQDQIGFNLKGFDLDKDLVFKGNKLYSEDTCFFVPHEVNSILNSCSSSRGNLPIGITKCGKSRFLVRLSKKSKRIEIGRFASINDAFLAYCSAKEDYLKEVAMEYKSVIHSKVYESLINYKVGITD